MEIQKLDGLAYDKESGFIGVITGVDYIKEKVKVVLEDGNEELLDINNVVYLERVGEIDGEPLFNRDILVYTEEYAEKFNAKIDDVFWEVELQEDGKLVMHLLKIEEQEFKRIKSGEPFEKELLNKLVKGSLEILGNFYQLEINEDEEDALDFNIKIAKYNHGTHIEYLYVCNNKEKEEVDLIKVVFVGANLLEEEDYSRETLKYDEYLYVLEKGILHEVSPQELQNYVTGMLYGKKVVADSKEEDLDIEIDDDGDKEEATDFDTNCPECGETYFDCECD